MRRDYLDGLRGWASLFVLFSHLGPVFLLTTTSISFAPFFMDGQLAVYVFFVLSGFVLSIGFFESGKKSVLKSLAIRRYPRLTIPIIASCAIALLLIEAGAMYNAPASIAAKSEWLGLFYNFPTSFASMIKYSTVDVYFEGTLKTYNPVLWTMHYELIGSFLVLAGLYFLNSTRLRIVGYLASLSLAFYFQSPLAAFAFGVLLADLSRLPIISKLKPSRAKSITAFILLISILYLVMLRVGHTATPFGLSAASFLIIWLVSAIPACRKAFGSPLSLWLGHISFPLYLTHVLVICSASSAIYLGLTDLGISFFSTSVITALTTIAMAICAAILFSPIEDFAIQISRKLSSVVMRRKSDLVIG